MVLFQCATSFTVYYSVIVSNAHCPLTKLPLLYHTMWPITCIFACLWKWSLTVSSLSTCLCLPAIPVGIVVVRGDCDLETCRLYIDRLQEASFPLYLHHYFNAPLPLSPLLVLPHHHYFMMLAASSLSQLFIDGYAKQHQWERRAVCLMWETFANRANIRASFWCKCFGCLLTLKPVCCAC